MPKKSKKVAKTKVTRKVNKTVAKKVTSKQSNSPMGFLFRRYDNNIAFTLMVSCAAYAIFMMVNVVLQRTDLAIYQQEQQLAAMQNTQMGQVAGVSDSQE